MNSRILIIFAVVCVAQICCSSQDFDEHKYHAAFGSTRPVTRPIKPLTRAQRYQLHTKYLDMVRTNIHQQHELNAHDIFPYQGSMIQFCTTTGLFQNLHTKLSRNEIKDRIWLAVQHHTRCAMPTKLELQEICKQEKNIIAAIESFQKQHHCGRYHPAKK